MLQTIFEGFSTDGIIRSTPSLSDLTGANMHNVNNTVDVKTDVPLALEPVSPLDLRTDGRTQDPTVWERQLQQELALIQKQQQIQKQLLISEFQKQHENLLRQHQVQLQEHLKLQQELQVMKQRQEQLEQEKKLEQQNQERELERNRRHQQVLLLRNRERARESAVASTEVKQKLQEFLLNKSTKDPLPNGSCHALSHSKLWMTNSQHTSLEQSSPPLGGGSPSYMFPLPPLQDYRDDFPLRKTASEPNLKVRSRLKQKVAERRSSPLLRRKEGTVMTPFKKRALELMESSSSNSAPGSGPSSPNGASSALGAENGPSSLPTTTRTERWPSQPKLLGPEGPATVLSLYTSPSLPNISFGLSTASSPISAGLGLKENPSEGSALMGVSSHVLGPVLLPVTMETKVSSSQQALLQHLLQKEQLRQHKILSTGPGSVSVHPPSPLAMNELSLSSVRPKLQRHRPLHRTQSAPLPQSMLAQLVIQQQHQNFLEKQKQYQQQVHINTLLSRSIEHLRQPGGRLHESEEEEEDDPYEREVSSLSAGVIRKCSTVSKIKEEPVDFEDQSQVKESTYLQPVNGRLVIRATI